MPALTRVDAISLVVTAVAQGEPRHFYVGIVGYYIEGRPYSADGLTVGPDSTPNLVATTDGFTCDTYFPPVHLEASIVQTNGVFTSTSGIDLVRVSVEVKHRDIWAVAEFVNGEQHDLFLDPGTLTTRKRAFTRELDAWRNAPEQGIH
jgi:hypothetical protein